MRMLTSCVGDSTGLRVLRSRDNKSIYHVSLCKAVLTRIIPIFTNGKQSVRKDVPFENSDGPGTQNSSPLPSRWLFFLWPSWPSRPSRAINANVQERAGDRLFGLPALCDLCFRSSNESAPSDVLMKTWMLHSLLGGYDTQLKMEKTVACSSQGQLFAYGNFRLKHRE